MKQYIYIGKSVPIDNYEQYKRVINQTNGGLYMHINIYLCACVCGNLQQFASEPFIKLCFEAGK